MKPEVIVTEGSISVKTKGFDMLIRFDQGMEVSGQEKGGRQIAETHPNDKLQDEYDRHPAAVIGRKSPARKPKKCPVCGVMFTPTGNSQIYCGKICKNRGNKNPLTPEQEAELITTLQEIEKRNREPYKFDR